MTEKYVVFIYDSHNTGYYSPQGFNTIGKARRYAGAMGIETAHYRIEGKNGFFEEYENREKTSWSA